MLTPPLRMDFGDSTDRPQDGPKPAPISVLHRPVEALGSRGFPVEAANSAMALFRADLRLAELRLLRGLSCHWRNASVTLRSFTLSSFSVTPGAIWHVRNPLHRFFADHPSSLHNCQEVDKNSVLKEKKAI
jgi:hypothetical protein